MWRMTSLACNSAEQALKCEIDSWPGPVVYLGPKALDAMLKPFNACIKVFLLQDLPDKQLLPPTGYGLVHQGHFIPFWNDAFHGHFASRPWISGPTLEFTRPWQEVASKLGCHLDVTTRALVTACYMGPWCFFKCSGRIGGGGAIASTGSLENWCRLLGAGTDCPV